MSNFFVDLDQFVKRENSFYMNINWYIHYLVLTKFTQINTTALKNVYWVIINCYKLEEQKIGNHEYCCVKLYKQLWTYFSLTKQGFSQKNIELYHKQLVYTFFKQI